MSKISYAMLMAMVCTPVVPTGCLVVAVDEDMFGILPGGHTCRAVLERNNKRDRVLRHGESLVVYVVKPVGMSRYRITNQDGKANVVREYPIDKLVPVYPGDGMP